MHLKKFIESFIRVTFTMEKLLNSDDKTERPVPIESSQGNIGGYTNTSVKMELRIEPRFIFILFVQCTIP